MMKSITAGDRVEEFQILFFVDPLACRVHGLEWFMIQSRLYPRVSRTGIYSRRRRTITLPNVLCVPKISQVFNPFSMLHCLTLESCGCESAINTHAYQSKVSPWPRIHSHRSIHMVASSPAEWYFQMFDRATSQRKSNRSRYTIGAAVGVQYTM